MAKKNLLVVETGNPYKADIYGFLFRKNADDHEVSYRTRKFVSHEGEQDYKIYTRFKAMVTKEQEKAIREGIKSSWLPTYKYNKSGYIRYQVRSAYEGVPFPFDIQKEVEKNEEN
jgi:hypothetical protein